MSSDSAEHVVNQAALPADQARIRRPVYGHDPQILADIYQDDINIAIWQRHNSELLQDAVREFLVANPKFETAITVSPDSARAQVNAATGGRAPMEFSENVGDLVAMFCDLFGLQRAGLRLATLDRAMCPRFHVDRVPCRLLTTYHGVATEWLPHDVVDRSKLGPGSRGQSDHVSGLFVLAVQRGD